MGLCETNVLWVPYSLCMAKQYFRPSHGEWLHPYKHNTNILGDIFSYFQLRCKVMSDLNGELPSKSKLTLTLVGNKTIVSCLTETTINSINLDVVDHLMYLVIHSTLGNSFELTVAHKGKKYSRTSMARTPLGPWKLFETGVVRANDGWL